MPEVLIERTPAKRQYARSEDTRARILTAALQEAGESGFNNTSVAKIAARAGVAVGILNYHFGSKGKLLRELMASQIGEFLALLDYPTDKQDFFTYEATILEIYLGFLRANPSYIRLAEEVRSHDPTLYRRGIDEHVHHIVQRLQRGLTRGDLRAMSPDAVLAQSYFMLGVLTFLDRYVEDPTYPGDKAATDYYINALRGGLSA